RPAAQEIAPFHLMMLLRRGERMFLARLANRQAVAEPKRIGSAKCVRVESRMSANSTNLCTPVTKVQCHGIFCLTGLNPYRRFYFAAAKLQLDDIPVADLFTRRECRTNQPSIFPG